MRLLKINDTFVDIDEKTAIGIDFQKYDIKEPGVRKMSVSNTFSIPKTDKNIFLFDFADNPQSISTSIYDKYTVNYWVDNYHLIKNGELRIDEISDRIKLYVVEKKDFWEELKDYKYIDFLEDYLLWLKTTKGEYVQTYDEDGFVGTFSEFMDRYVDNTSQNHFICPYYFGEYFLNDSIYEYDDEENLAANGGRFCTYVKYIFQFLQSKYDVDFLLTSADETIIWNDEYVDDLYVPLRDIGIGYYLSKWYLVIRSKVIDGVWSQVVLERKDKSMYDFVKTFIQKFNIIIDDYTEDDVYYIEMRRFDDIKTKADVVDFSGNIVLNKIVMKPYIKGFEQKNRILYENVYPEGDESLGAKIITCNNKNLEKTIDLFKIDDYYPNVLINSDSESVVSLRPEESYDSWVFMISTELTTSYININLGTGYTCSKKLMIAAIYGLDGEYTFIEEILAYPKMYEIYKWLSLKDVLNLDFFKQYFIKELGGSFFINKISGFNPEKTNKPTKIEVIKISNKSPYDK